MLLGSKRITKYIQRAQKGLQGLPDTTERNEAHKHLTQALAWIAELRSEKEIA